MYTPDRWVVLKIDTFYKVFGTWVGGYVDGDSWRLNSGIKSVVSCGDSYNFIGYSGSVYSCRKDNVGTSSYTSAVLEGILKHKQVSLLDPMELDEFLEKNLDKESIS